MLNSSHRKEQTISYIHKNKKMSCELCSIRLISELYPLLVIFIMMSKQVFSKYIVENQNKCYLNI